MKRLDRCATYAALCVLLAGCDLDVPKIVAGDAAMSEGGKVVRTWKLTPENIASTSAWFGARRTSWSPDFVTPSAQVSVKLSTADGVVMGVYLLEKTVIVSSGKGQFRQSFAVHDIAAFKEAVGVSK
jgi:hypothetical protein